MSKQLLVLRHWLLLGLLFLTMCVFAEVPLNDTSLRGDSAAEVRRKLVESAESYLGAPYRYAGLDRRGLDCSGLVYLSFMETLNCEIPRTAENIYSWVKKINTDELHTGDLVFFVTAGSRVSHVGIYTGEDRFIHSASSGPQTGVMYSSLNESYWKRTYIGAGRALPLDAGTPQVILVRALE